MKQLIISVRVGENTAYGIETSDKSDYAAECRYEYHTTKAEGFEKPTKKPKRPRKITRSVEDLLERNTKRRIGQNKHIKLLGNVISSYLNPNYHDHLPFPNEEVVPFWNRKH